MSLRVLDRKALRAKGVTYSNVHLLRLEAEDKFPRRFQSHRNRVAWLEKNWTAGYGSGSRLHGPVGRTGCFCSRQQRPVSPFAGRAWIHVLPDVATR